MRCEIDIKKFAYASAEGGREAPVAPVPRSATVSAQTSNHVWKFHGNWPRRLGDMALQKERKKNISSKTLGNYPSERPNKAVVFQVLTLYY